MENQINLLTEKNCLACKINLGAVTLVSSKIRIEYPMLYNIQVIQDKRGESTATDK